MIRGAVVVPGSFSQSFERPDSDAPPTGEQPGSPTSPGAMPSWDSLVDQAADVAPVPLWRRIPLGAILVVVLVSAGAIGAFLFNAARGSSGEINRGGDLEASALRVGDCYDLKDPDAEEFDKVTAVPCADEHQYELFYAGAMPDGPYPSDAVMSTFVEERCPEAFGTYVGKPYADSELEILWVSPTAASWADGDRTIQCSAYHPLFNRLTKSLKSSGE
jgi:putative regulator of septum formation